MEKRKTGKAGPGEQRYDLAVIGAGASGMMAAAAAAERGATVVLVEKNPLPGRKLLLTGNGRCNLTNETADAREFIERLGGGPGALFLFSALAAFGPRETISFFERIGLPTRTERGGRVFPASERAGDLVLALSRHLRRNGVSILSGVEVRDIVFAEGRVSGLLLARGRKVAARSYLLATGGLSFSRTGSTGDGYLWARRAGHSVSELSPSLVPVLVREKFVRQLEGLSLRNIGLALRADGRELERRFGEAVFTENGLSGPAAIDMSRTIARHRGAGLVIGIDFKPALSAPVLDRRLQSDFALFGRRFFRNSLDQLLPRRMIPVVVSLSGIPPEKQAGEITRAERRRLLDLLKNFPLEVSSLAGYNRAFTTAGGVATGEVEQATMRSRLVPNLYLAGEVLDLDGPTGGFNLQIAWTTGHAAGAAAAARRAGAKQPRRGARAD